MSEKEAQGKRLSTAVVDNIVAAARRQAKDVQGGSRAKIEK
jgi:hypothetical protein